MTIALPSLSSLKCCNLYITQKIRITYNTDWEGDNSWRSMVNEVDKHMVIWSTARQKKSSDQTHQKENNYRQRKSIFYIVVVSFITVTDLPGFRKTGTAQPNGNQHLNRSIQV